MPYPSVTICLDEGQEESIDSVAARGFTHDLVYLEAVFASLGELLVGSKVRFILTRNHHKIPFSGPDVVVFLVNDEWNLKPRYLDKIGALVRTAHFTLPIRPGERPYLYSSVLFLKWCRNLITRVNFGAKNSFKFRTPRPIFQMPLGTFNMPVQKPKPYKDREFDVSFVGSWSGAASPGASKKNRPRIAFMIGRIFRPFDPKYVGSLELTPKNISRSYLLEGLKNCGSSVKVNLVNTRDLTPLSPKEFAELLLNTKIAPSPAGSMVECWRTYQAAASGCIVISEPPPNTWYFKKFPGPVIKDWRRVDRTINSVLEDPERAEELRLATLEWYNDFISPGAVSAYLAPRLRKALLVA